MRIGIIGAGKVGTTLGKYLQFHGVPVAGYVSRSFQSAMSAAGFTETTAYHTLEELVSVSDTLFLATPDGVIGEIWDCIKKTELAGKIICHFSGSLSSYVFSGIGQTGASGCSFHPMYAFSGRFTSYRQFHTAIFTIEGGQKAVEGMTALFGDALHHKILPIRAEDKMKYHAAAAMASNYMLGLFQISLDLLGDCGFSEQDGREILKPLVQVNVESMLERGPREALTGPVERNDVDTVKKHLQAITGSCESKLQREEKTCIEGTHTGTERIYRELGLILTSMAETKNPDRNYAQLRKVLKYEQSRNLT